MPGQIRGSLALALAVLTGGALLGCSQKTPPASVQAPPPFATSPAAGEQFDAQDPCNLLDPKEVEAVLGAPLAVPPYRSGNGTVSPTPDGDTCIYETAGFRYIAFDVTYEGGTQAYSMTGMVKGLMKSGGGSADIAHNAKRNFRLDDGTELAGEWDEASLMPMNCCIFLALRGDQLITMDFTASPATLRQAATLVDSAYKRIDQPLKIDGGAGVAAAKALDKTRPKPVDVCSLLSRADVEAILGKLASDPKPSKSGCEYQLPSPGTPPQVYDVELRWRGGYSDWRSDRYVNRIGQAAVGQIAADVTRAMGKPLPEPELVSHEQADPGAAAAAPDPAESVSNNGMHFVIVKRDVQVSVNSMFVDRARAQALITAIAAKI